MVEYLIVGQGIAGTLIAMECVKRGLSFRMIDAPEDSSASEVAAGIINPLTGRKFVKTWMYEELEKVFLPSYRWAEELLDSSYLEKKTIIRALPNIKDRNNWDARMLQDDAALYMENIKNAGDFDAGIRSSEGFGSVSGYQLKIGSLVGDFRNFLTAKGWLQLEKVDHSRLEFTPGEVAYGALTAKGVIFCEGHLVSKNPFFNELPFTPAKGELLVVRIPGLKTSQILKDHLFIAPLQDDIFWVGASYAWENFNDIPSTDKKLWLEESLAKIIKIPYEILDHQAGVRPATKYRRPLMGTHKSKKQVHLFNGLGTKGASLGPFWAQHFMDYLEGITDLHKDVRIH